MCKTPRVLFLAALSLCAVFSVAEQRFSVPDSIPLQQLLDGPDHRDFPCKVKAHSPILTFQQRFLVGITTSMKVKNLLKKASFRDLHYVIKVKDENGVWVSGQDYQRFPVPLDTSGRIEIVSSAGILFRPGHYVVATIIFDTIHKQSVVIRTRVTVLPLKHDPLPVLDELIPNVEFRAETPDYAFDENQSQDWDNVAHPTYVNGSWAFSHFPFKLEVPTARPTAIDLIVNVSPSYRYDPSSIEGYKANAAVVLQIASALSGIRPLSGSVHLTFLDMLRENIVLDREDATTLDWDRVLQTIGQVNQAHIDVQTLANRNQGVEYLRDFLAKLLPGDESCRCSHLVILISTSQIFPKQMRIVRLPAKGVADGELFYFRPLIIGGDLFDQIKDILSPAQPTVFQIYRAEEFRKDLARVVSLIKQPVQP